MNGARRRTRPQPLSQEALEVYALRALTRRAHSVAELRAKLLQRALPTASTAEILARLSERGWLDDRRFALGFARSRAARRYGRRRIAMELRRRGVTDELIEEALAEVLPGEADERRMIRQRLDRKLRGKPRPYTDKVVRSAYGSLLRAGFSSAIIRDELFRRTRRGFTEDDPEAS
ncbi:MAG: regulatory protein RecX [Candidatus Acidiferrales bacterium]